MTVHQVEAAQNRHSDAPSSRRVDRHPSETPQRHERSNKRNSISIDQLSLSRIDELQVDEDSRSLSVLRSRTQLRIRQSDDGSVKLKFKSQLKFDYEFQSDDGTTIKLSAKIKTRISYKQTGEDSYELKSRVKFQLSAALESVQSGVAPALESDLLSGEQGSAISTALEEFASLIDRVSSEFLGESLGGDDLVVNLVDGFNQFSGSVQPNLPTELPPPPPPVDSAEENADTIPTADDTDATDVAQSAVVDTSAVESSDQQPAGSVEESTNSAPVVNETPLAPVDDAAIDAATLATEPTTPALEINQTVLVDLRFKFVQSIKQLVTVLDSADEDATTSVNTSVSEYAKLDLRFAVASQTGVSGESVPGINIDA